MQKYTNLKIRKGEKMNYRAEKREKATAPTAIEKFRIIFGFLMMISGIYFGFFTVGAGESLGVLSLMASPFVMVTDK